MMRWKLRDPCEWRSWFAWYPWLIDGELVWLETVEWRMSPVCVGTGAYWNEYR